MINVRYGVTTCEVFQLQGDAWVPVAKLPTAWLPEIIGALVRAAPRNLSQLMLEEVQDAIPQKA